MSKIWWLEIILKSDNKSGFELKERIPPKKPNKKTTNKQKNPQTKTNKQTNKQKQIKTTFCANTTQKCDVWLSEVGDHTTERWFRRFSRKIKPFETAPRKDQSVSKDDDERWVILMLNLIHFKRGRWLY